MAMTPEVLTSTVSVASEPNIRIDENDRLYEIIDGIRINKPVGNKEVLFANHLAYLINKFAVPRRLGLAMVEVLLDLGKHDRPRRRPDLIFVSQERLNPKGKLPTGDTWTIVPELAVEVVSPSNYAFEIQSKILEYFDSGISCVWIIYAEIEMIYVYDGPTSVRLVDRAGELDCGAFLPGLRIPMADIFGDDAAAPAPPA